MTLDKSFRKGISLLVRILFVFFVIALFACANPVPPGGGLTDTEPPKLDSARSSPGMLTNFNETRLVFTFDEWFELNDPFNQILISPEIDPRPNFRVRGRRLLVDIDPGSLRDNTTYSIFFGTAIRDITERNAVENFKYVFSTGDYIDSLYLKFRVVDAFTNRPAEKIMVLLYDEYQDSLLMNTRPFYALGTNQNGEVQFENLRPGSYQVRALLDQNFSYTYDQANEKIGFLNFEVEPRQQADTTFNIRLFQEPVPYRALQKRQAFPGFLAIALNNPATSLDSIVTFPRGSVDLSHQFFRDSLWLWATNGSLPDSLDIWLEGSAKSFRVIVPEPLADAAGRLNIASDKGTTAGRGRGAQPVIPAVLREAQSQNPNLPFRLTMHRPIASIDTARIWLQSDSIKVDGRKEVTISGNDLLIKLPWKADSSYTLIIDAAAIRDVFGHVNDSLTIQLRIPDIAQMGNIDITVSNLNPTFQYLIELLRGEDVLEQFCVRDLSAFKTKLASMQTGNYQLRVIEDRIENCNWDTGNYLRKTQPERIWVGEAANLRANWDLELILSLN